MKAASEQRAGGARHATAPNLYAVIMAGGQGTRFWPLSRRQRPKQFLRLFGTQTLLRATAERVLPLTGWERLLVVTQQRYAAAVRAELPELPRTHVLAEPSGKNTLPCLLFAAAWIARQDPHATMIATPADHLIAPASLFRSDLERAARLARAENCLVTLGVAATRPETGYGYIERGAPFELKRNGAGFWVRRFHEKPDAARARRYVRSGRFFWNSGIFVWPVDVFAAAVEAVAPQTWQHWQQVVPRRARIARQRLRARYAQAESCSVDVAVLEPLSTRKPDPTVPRVAVLPARFRWSDVGGWRELAELLPKTAAGNAEHGNVVALDAHDCLAWSEGRLVALVGVRDLVVVETEDALLVCAKERTQAVRELVAELERQRAERWL